jgi:UDP-N-acetylglucosamine 1-carboxyvinyltransferase
MSMEATRITSTVAPYDLVRKMRASILVLGPMLARAGEATVSMPGGCAIGNRPIDLHLKALEAFGAHIELAQGYVKAYQPDGGMPGGDFDFPVVSVGATENALMAAVLANGTSRLFNAAREPEIVDLCNMLVAMGAEIEGIGTSNLVIHGVKRLHGATYRVMPDRIEAGSYACAAAITGGEVRLEGARADEMMATIHALQAIGCDVTWDAKSVTVAANGPLKATNLTTAPYPGLATDMQAQLMALLCKAEGASVLKETIFENRFMHVPELARMAADITTEGRTAVVKGSVHLTGAEVMATDLRASMSLVIAALAAEGETTVRRLYHLDRGYERLEEKLQLVGADIERVDD